MAYLSAKDLLTKKEAIKARADERIVIEIKDVGEMLFKVPSRESIADANAFGDDDRADDYLVYANILEPNLRDPDLQKEFLNKSQEPVEIVAEIFKPGEVRTIAEKLMESAGYFDDDIKARKAVKN